MTKKELKILAAIMEIIPSLSELEKEKLLSFSEGMAFLKRKESKNAK